MIRRLAAAVVVCLSASSCAVLDIGPSACGGTLVFAEFEQVGDLVEQAQVQSGDVQIGSVSEIELDRDEWTADVEMCIEADEDISRDVEAVVRTTSLLGEKFIDLKVQSTGPPFLEDGDVITLANTSKAAELEDVFARLATVLGTGNLEQMNRFTSAQADILRGKAGKLRTVLEQLRRFTDLLADHKGQLTASIDSLDSVARTVLDDSDVLQRFLRSFADSSGVLSRQRVALERLLVSLDRFTAISIRLLGQTEEGLNDQFRDLRPVLRTLVRNSRNVARTLTTLATFTQWFPETMPGDYTQLDVCQANPEDYNQGVNCPQAVGNDDPRSGAPRGEREPESSLQMILEQPLRGGQR